MGAGEKCVEHLVAGTDTHDYDAVLQIAIVIIKRIEDVFEDNGAVWIVDGGMTAEQQLRSLIGKLPFAKG